MGMSDQMLLSILRMPFPDNQVELGAIEWLQFRDRMRQAADEIERLRAELAAEREQHEYTRNALHEALTAANDAEDERDTSEDRVTELAIRLQEARDELAAERSEEHTSELQSH